MHLILIWVVIALPIYAMYKGIAIIAAKLLSAVVDKGEATQR
jgi:hypothetical protein